MEISTDEKMNFASFIQQANDKLEKEVNRLLGENVENSASENILQAEEENEPFEKIMTNFQNYSQMETMLRSGLLGFYVNDKYDISADVKKDLLVLKKVADDESDNVIKCHSFYSDHVFNFVVEYDNFTTYSVAKIFLLEEKDDINNVEKLKTLIAEEVMPGGENIADSISKIWNIRKPTDEEGETQTVTLTALDAVLTGAKTDYAFSRELMEILSQIYILRMTALLGKVGEEGQKILNEYNNIVKGLAITRPSVLQSYSKLKNIFDKVVSKNNGIELVRKMDENSVSEVMSSYYKPLERLNIKVSKVDEIIAVDKEEKKVKQFEKIEKKEEKAKKVEKSGGSKKSGGKSSDVKGPTVKPWGSYKYNDTVGKIKIPVFPVLKPKAVEPKGAEKKNDKPKEERIELPKEPAKKDGLEPVLKSNELFNLTAGLGDSSVVAVVENDSRQVTAGATQSAEVNSARAATQSATRSAVDLTNIL